MKLFQIAPVGSPKMVTTKQEDAIYLMIEDLWDRHERIRILAKENNCESELNSIRDDSILYLVGSILCGWVFHRYR
jgi:hypothetical protein